MKQELIKPGDDYISMFFRIASYPLFKLLMKTKISPMQVTLFGALLWGVAFILLFFGYNIFALILFILSFVFDVIDGQIARVRNIVSDKGNFFDGMFDHLRNNLVYLIAIILVNTTVMIILYVIAMFVWSEQQKSDSQRRYLAMKSNTSVEIVDHNNPFIKAYLTFDSLGLMFTTFIFLSFKFYLGIYLVFSYMIISKLFRHSYNIIHMMKAK